MFYKCTCGAVFYSDEADGYCSKCFKRMDEDTQMSTFEEYKVQVYNFSKKWMNFFDEAPISYRFDSPQPKMKELSAEIPSWGYSKVSDPYVNSEKHFDGMSMQFVFENLDILSIKIDKIDDMGFLLSLFVLTLRAKVFNIEYTPELKKWCVAIFERLIVLSAKHMETQYCPVCGHIKIKETTECNICGFVQDKIEFINKDDAMVWRNNIVEPYKQEYYKNTYKDFVIEDGVLEEYTGSRKYVVLPENVTTIGSMAFLNKDIGVEELYLPTSIERLNEFAFDGLSSLKNIYGGTGLKVIGRRAFSDCDSLEKIKLPDTIICLEEGFCDNLIEVEISNEKYEVIDDAVIDKESNILLHCWSKKQSYFVNGNVKKVGKYAFPPIDTDFRLINLMEGVEVVSERFVRELTQLYIPSTVKKIEEGALTGVRSVALSEKNKTYRCENNCIVSNNDRALIGVNNKLLTNYDIPKDAEKISKYAFANCINLKNIVIPQNVSQIGRNIFFKCRNLQNIFLEHEEISEGWDNRWNSSNKVNVYLKNDWHYEPVLNNPRETL